MASAGDRVVVTPIASPTPTHTWLHALVAEIRRAEVGTPTALARICRRKCLRDSRLRVMSTTIRVSEETRDRLASLANATGRPMTRILEDAVEALERRIFFETLNRRYQQLRDDPEAWAEIEQERRAEEGAVGDSSR